MVLKPIVNHSAVHAGSDIVKPHPILNNVITNKECGIVREENYDKLDIDRILGFFQDPIMSKLNERHFHELKKLLKYCQKGFLFKDVIKVVKLLNILADRIDKDESYIPSLCSLLGLFKYPFLKEKASDELVYEQVIIECLANIGYLFRMPYMNIRSEICTCIHNLITFAVVSPPHSELQRCSKAFILKCVCSSDLPETLIKSLTLMEDDLDIRLRTMKIIQKLSTDEKNCNQMLEAECANRLVLKIDYPHQNEELLFRSVEILWNLLEFGNRLMVADQLNSLTAISKLRDAFMIKFLQGFSNYDRQMRNDLLSICIQLLQIMPSLPFIEAGFAKELLLFATYPETKSHNPLTKNIKLTTCYEDFELKKLFFNFVVIVSKNSTSKQLLSESGIMLALLSFLKPIDFARNARDWTVSQFEELQLHAMSTLCIITPILLDEFLACRGNNILLSFLDWCLNEKNDFVCNGNSFHAKGGRGSKRSQLKYCLRLIRSIVSLENEDAIQDLSDQGAIGVLLKILEKYSRTIDKYDQIDVDILSDILFILTCICESDLHRKELFGQEGIDLLLDMMRKNPSSIWNGLGYQRLIISVIDCIWAVLSGCVLNEDYFIQKEGVFHLLDILETTPKLIKNLILGCLVDLSDNPKTLIHFLQWEGKDGAKISHFLCTLWRNEEKDNFVERDENGIILNINKPLANQESAHFHNSYPSKIPSRAIVEVSENMRAKIYGIFSKLSFSELPGVSSEDQLTICIIENYLDFKLGEVFEEISNELKMEGIQPIPPDQEALETILRAAEDRVQTVNMNQQLMAHTFKQQEYIQEKEFYYEIKGNFAYKEKKLAMWRDYLARVSKYTALMESKNKQLTAIEDSRPHDRESAAYETNHNLEIPNLAVTCFATPFIVIDSTPAEITGGRLRKMIEN